jgi:solute carrier family 9 (sodium/hydrogen exchanger), member 6/7
MQSFLGVEVLLAIVTLILYVFTAQFLENKKFEYLHETTIAIIVGAIGGISLNIIAGADKIEFSTGIFFYFILPPIIFTAGYTLKSQNFFLNIGFILLYGVIGTFLSFVTLGCLAVFFSENGAVSTKISVRDCLLLASVLSATDTVAAITVIKETKYPKLHYILFGEGVLNDAVSIVLFRTVNSLTEKVESLQVFELLSGFFMTTVLSVLVGITVGLSTSLILKRFPGISMHPERESTVVILFGYLSYTISEILGLSGIMAIFFCGVIMAHYAWHNLSTKSQEGTQLVFRVISQGAEAFTVTYLGMTVTTITDWNLMFFACMFVAVILGRGASIFISTAFVYLIQRGHFGLDYKSISVVWFGGLIRGSVAFAMVLQIESPNSDILVSTTLGIALVTTVGLGNLMNFYTKLIGLEQNSSEGIYFELISVTPKNDPVYSKNLQASGLGSFHRLWQKIDEKYLGPIFGAEEKIDGKAVWEKIWAEEDAEMSPSSK